MARRPRRAPGPQAPEIHALPDRSAVRWWLATLLVAAVALTYANSLAIPFILDDQATIVQNPQIRDLSRLGDLVTPAPESPVAGRPLASLSFALNYAAGGLEVRGYHLANIALHVACALLILLVVQRTLSLPRIRQTAGASPWALAFAAALLWAVHPLNSEVVNYLSQRTESLMALFYLLTLYAAIRAADSSRRQHAWLVLAIAACAAGVLSKETMATAPVIVALYDRVFLFESWRAAVERRRPLYAGLAATWIVAAVLVAAGPRAGVAGFSSGVSPWIYLLNQAVVITEYLRLTVWPDALVVLYGWPVPVTFADVAPYVVFIAGLVVATAVALWRWPAPGFAGAWFFITLAPASSIVPVATEVGAERRMYLPLAALAIMAVLLVAAILSRLWRRDDGAQRSRASRARAWAPVAIAVALSAVLAVITVARNREYQSALSLARTVVERRPTGIAHHYLAEQLLRARQDDEAGRHLREAVALGNSRAGYLLGRLLLEQGHHAEAIGQLDLFLRTSELPYRLVPRWLEPPVTEVIPARFALAQASAMQGEWERAVEQAQRILADVPSHVGAHGILADAAFARQQWTAAAEHYRTYLDRQPADVGALISYGITQIAEENLDEAIDSFERASRIDPANARARQLLAMAQQDRASLAAEP